MDPPLLPFPPSSSPLFSLSSSPVLLTDPSEQVNLYGTSDIYEAIQEELYSKLDEHVANARTGDVQ